VPAQHEAAGQQAALGEGFQQAGGKARISLDGQAQIEAVFGNVVQRVHRIILRQGGQGSLNPAAVAAGRRMRPLRMIAKLTK
jgi:hypothetical protein